jgi:hypothetical protein
MRTKGNKRVLSLDIYDVPKKNKTKYVVRGPDCIYSTNDIDEVLEKIRTEAVGEVDSNKDLDDGFKDLRMKPKGKVLLKAKTSNQYAGGDSKWHLVTGYIEGDDYSILGDESIFVTFAWNGEKDERGIDLPLDGKISNIIFKRGTISGEEITAKQAVDIITGREEKNKKQKPKEKAHGRHNNKKADRRKV